MQGIQGALITGKNHKMLDTFIPNVMINNNIETSSDNFTDHELRITALKKGEETTWQQKRRV